MILRHGVIVYSWPTWLTWAASRRQKNSAGELASVCLCEAVRISAGEAERFGLARPVRMTEVATSLRDRRAEGGGWRGEPLLILYCTHTRVSSPTLSGGWEAGFV
jgi:hypothetical protein